MHLYLHCTPLSPGGTEICILQAHMHALHWDLKHSLHIHCSLSPELGTHLYCKAGLHQKGALPQNYLTHHKPAKSPKSKQNH